MLTFKIIDKFDLRDISNISLFRAYTNDVYIIQTSSNKYVLKVYGETWRSASEILWEIDLLSHLADKGIPVAKAIMGRNGAVLKKFAIEGRDRYGVLFEYADGEKPQPPFSDALYYNFGKVAAQMHRAADDFTSAHQRPPLDLAYLVDEPVGLALHFLNNAADAKFLEQFTQKLKSTVNEFASGGLDWGPVHNDLTLDNVHVTDSGQIILYDFDSGGMGWRAIDLHGYATFYPEYDQKRQSFLKGYREIRPLSQNDIDAAPYLYVALEIWSIKVELENRVIPKGDTAIAAYLKETLEKLRGWKSIWAEE
ncbi:MAG: phosphotransferase [Chloroflexi bacterium]|nr:phosphotransferase [Chloroflexota bacterium]